MSKELEAFEKIVQEANECGMWHCATEIDIVEQALTKLKKLDRLLTLMSYHCVVELKETSVEKSKIYIEYKEEIQEFKRLFYEIREL